MMIFGVRNFKFNN